MPTRAIRNDHDRKLLIRWLESMKPPYVVTTEKGKLRSTEQNRLQRLWINEIAEQLGDRSPEEVRGYCKLTIGVPILRAENEAFREAYDRVIKPLAYETKLAAMMEPLDFAVTRLMTVAQKTQYLDEMARRFVEQGMRLSHPDDLGRAA